MRLFIWLWGTIKNIFSKKPIQDITLPREVELKPVEDDSMESLEGFIDVTLTV
jgi:hypothetical protein